MSQLEEKFQTPGDVVIRNLELINSRGIVVNLKENLVELNLYESIFSRTITGSIILSDDRNLLKVFPILGEELLLINVKTPTLDNSLAIHKMFRVYSVNNKVYSGDGSTQLYKLNFCSVEMFRDVSNSIFQSYSGQPDQIVQQIYLDYLTAPRYIDPQTLRESEEFTNFTILNPAENVIKFVSPGWSPIQCIDWVASKSYSQNMCNFLFWETSKGFYFGSMEQIYKLRPSIGNYVYSSSFVSTLDRGDLVKNMATIKTLTLEKDFNQLDNNLDGYLASRLIDVDLYNKTYENIDYDHVSKFFEYPHTAGEENSFPLFSINTSRNPTVYQQLNYRYPKIYDGIDNNFNETKKLIFGNRRSTMLELDNFKMKIGIPGRTDIEAGTLIAINLPKASPAFTEDKSTNFYDELYSGYYLITSLNHKINLMSHFITCDLAKDSFPMEPYFGK